MCRLVSCSHDLSGAGSDTSMHLLFSWSASRKITRNFIFWAQKAFFDLVELAGRLLEDPDGLRVHRQLLDLVRVGEVDSGAAR